MMMKAEFLEGLKVYKATSYTWFYKLHIKHMRILHDE